MLSGTPSQVVGTENPNLRSLTKTTSSRSPFNAALRSALVHYLAGLVVVLGLLADFFVDDNPEDWLQA